jgi:hypothetical protein
MSDLQELDEKGFVFLDDANRPYWCRMYHGNPWIMSWHEDEGHWVTYRQVTQTEIWSFPHNLTDEQQEIYHRQERNSQSNVGSLEQEIT